MTVTAVTNNQTASAQLRVENRGLDIGPPDWSTVLTKTITSAHTAGDEVFICLAFDNANVADVLEAQCLAVDIPSSVIPISDWTDEVNEWLPSTTVSGIFYEPEDADKSLLKILEPYMLNMWYDPIDREIKLKAISNWVEASVTVTEGKEIDYNSISITEVESLRYSRAAISYDKEFLANPEEPASYKKSSLGIRPELETVDLYGTRPKTKKFNNSVFLDKDAADLLVSRYIQRFGVTPSKYNWTTQERNLTFKVGDVVNISSESVQGFDGLPSGNTRAQIIKTRPVDTKIGREYKVTALTYQPAISSGAVFTINSATELNLFVLAGAPSSAVDITFIFDGGVFKSTDVSRPAVKAGGFASGSKIIIILRNGADWQSKGGKGGKGGGVLASPVDAIQSPNPSNGFDAGIVYDAQGVDTDIYLSGADPQSGTALGTLRAPSGGDGGFDAYITAPPYVTGNGGGGGDGYDSGDGGDPGDPTGELINTEIGAIGDSGQTDGTDSGWGVDGVANDAVSGGLKGKGIVKNSAIVKVFGDTPSNFINGGGDTPDP